MMDVDLLSIKEQETALYYEIHAKDWAERRKKTTEPSFWQKEFEELKKLQIPKGKVLEIGSGAGREALELTALGYEYYGIDTSQELLKIAKKANPHSHFFHTSVYDLPFAPETFDAFFSWAMLPHVPKDRIAKALSSVRQVFKQNAIGCFAMREGTGEKQEPETSRWFSYYTEEEFEKILQSAGFKILKKYKKSSRPDLVWLIFFVQN